MPAQRQVKGWSAFSYLSFKRRKPKSDDPRDVDMTTRNYEGPVDIDDPEEDFRSRKNLPDC